MRSSSYRQGQADVSYEDRQELLGHRSDIILEKVPQKSRKLVFYLREITANLLILLVGRAGFEPATNWLKATLRE